MDLRNRVQVAKGSITQEYINYLIQLMFRRFNEVCKIEVLWYSINIKAEYISVLSEISSSLLIGVVFYVTLSIYIYVYAER